MKPIAPKVLVITPTYERQMRYIEDILYNIAYQKYRNYRCVILINNSHSPDYYNYVLRILGKIEKELKYPHIFWIEDLGTIEPIEGYKPSIGAQAYNMGLDKAIRGDYDYALLCPGDICLPLTSIRQLLKPFRKFKDIGLSCLTCHYRWSGDGGPEGIIEKATDLKFKRGNQIPMVLPLEDKIDAKQYYSQKYLKARAGDGAMMIPRKVFTKIKMRVQPLYDRIGPDIAYCLDMTKQLGLWPYIVTRVWTPHINVESDGKLAVY